MLASFRTKYFNITKKRKANKKKLLTVPVVCSVPVPVPVPVAVAVSVSVHVLSPTCVQIFGSSPRTQKKVKCLDMYTCTTARDLESASRKSTSVKARKFGGSA